MKIYRAADHRRMKWKNGGGETAEIAVYPKDSGLQDFGWRISMATVESDGPFSTFAGIERTLAVLSGNGIRLDINGMGGDLVKRDSPPLSFPADAAVDAKLLDGPITDLNIMTRRGQFSHRLRTLVANSRMDLQLSGRWNFLIPLADVEVCANGGTAQLTPFDALLAERGQSVEIRSQQQQSILYVAEIDPV